MKISDILLLDDRLTIPELAEQIGITTGHVEKNIKKLQNSDRLLRIDPDKGGRWKVLK